MAARGRAADLRGDRPASPGAASSGSGSTASASPAASPPCGPTCPCWSSKLRARSAIDLALTTNGATLRTLAARPRAAGLRRHQHLARLAARRPLRRADPARRAAGVLDGIDAAVEAGLRPGEGQRRGHARASTTTRSSTSPAFGRDEGVDGALHRVHAARRRAAPGPTTRWCRRPRSSRPSTRCSRSSRSPRGSRSGRAVPLPRRRRRVGRHPSVTEPFCDVRPGAPHRRGPAAHLPVRHRRARPAGLLRAGASDDELAAAIASRGRRQVGRATPSTRSTSSGPAESMSQIGG